MLHPSTQQLIRKLCELTDTGHIAWKEGERQCSLFESEGYIVEVEAEPPSLRLLRGDGRELERANPADLAATAWPDGGGTYAAHVTDLATKAHRIARGAEAAIARILTSLSDPTKPVAAPVAASALPPPHAAPPPELQKPAPEAPASTFGAVESFAKEPAPKPAPASSPQFLIKGFSARSVQAPESASVRAAPPPAKPAEQAASPAPSIYKPWN
jgi:hypothetical protein